MKVEILSLKLRYCMYTPHTKNKVIQGCEKLVYKMHKLYIQGDHNLVTRVTYVK